MNNYNINSMYIPSCYTQKYIYPQWASAEKLYNCETSSAPRKKFRIRDLFHK